MPSWGTSGNFQLESSHIAQLGSNSKNSQITAMARPEHINSYHPSKIPSCVPSHTPISNFLPPYLIPHINTTTHLNHPPSLLPLAPPPYSISHMGYTRPLRAAIWVTLHSYLRLNPTHGSSPGSILVYNRTKGLRRLDPGLEPCVVFSLEYECSVTHMAAQSGLV